MRARFPLCLAVVLAVCSFFVLALAGQPAGDGRSARPAEAHPADEEISPEVMDLVRRSQTLPRGERRAGERFVPPVPARPAR